MTPIETRARELLAKHASETGCEAFTGLVTVPLAIAALTEVLTRLEALHSATWQCLDDMGRANYVCVCPAAKDQLVTAYVAAFGDEGEDAPTEIINRRAASVMGE